jgi:arsenate reductase
VRLPEAAPNGNGRKTILFLSPGNSCRSQMAEGFARYFGAASHEVFSAGTHPEAINPLAVRVMRETGIDIANQRSKGLAEVPLESVDQIVTFGGEAEEECPDLGSRVQHSHWAIADPTLTQGSEEEVLAAFRRARDEIRSRLRELFLGDTVKSLLQSKHP